MGGPSPATSRAQDTTARRIHLFSVFVITFWWTGAFLPTWLVWTPLIVTYNSSIGNTERHIIMEETNNLQEPLLSEVEREEAVAKEETIEELEKGNASAIKESSIEEENPEEAPRGDDDDGSTPSPSSDSEPGEFSLKGELGGECYHEKV